MAVSEPGLDHNAIRALRGKLSRAAFARRLGVTPLTVYRWELPGDAAQARRPRGAQLSRIHQLIASGDSESGSLDSFARGFTATSRGGLTRLSGAEQQERESVVECLDGLLRPGWKRIELVLTSMMLAPGRLRSANARALALAALAQARLVHGGEAQSALTGLAGAWGSVEALTADTLAHVHATTALSLSMADGGLFDPRRIHQHASAAESLADASALVSPRLLAFLARLNAALVLDEPEELAAALELLPSFQGVPMPPSLALFVEEAEAVRMLRDGRHADALARLGVLANHPMGWPLLRARALALTARAHLEQGDAEQAVAHARSVRELAVSLELRPGLHLLLAGRVQAEAAIRMCRVAEAEQTLRHLSDICDETGIPGISMVPSLLRFSLITGRAEALRSLADRLGSCPIEPLRSYSLAYAALARALEELLTTECPLALHSALESAVERAEACPKVMGEIWMYSILCLIRVGRLSEAQRVVASVAKVLTEAPGWQSAQLMRLRGLLQTAAGEASAAMSVLQAAATRFRLVGSAADAAMVDREGALAATLAQQSGADGRLVEATRLLENVGLVASRWLPLPGYESAEDRAHDSPHRTQDVHPPAPVTSSRAADALHPLPVQRPVAMPEPPLELLPDFVAASEAMQAVVRKLAHVAPGRATVLLTGESGCGKEVLARAIHRRSPRREQPFVALNCGGVPRDLFEGTLFGFRRGSFTGAHADRRGLIRDADEGTLFLDEVGELPLEVQPKLLRFLENGEVLPLGESRPCQVNVRVVAATNRDLADLVKQGQFRADLFYRLNVIPIHLPPLRERTQDIVPLASLFLRCLSPPDRELPSLGQTAIAALLAHPWPGNVRELRNLIERAITLAPDATVLSASHLGL